MYAIFNRVSNADLLGAVNSSKITDKIGRKFSTSSDLNGEINNGINGHKFYQIREN